MKDTFEVVELPAINATRNNLAEYGLFIGTDVPHAGLTIPFYEGAIDEGHNFPFECHGRAVIRSAQIRKRSLDVIWLERHMLMTQLFIGLGNQPFAMVLGKPNHEAGGTVPDYEGIKCFIFPPGHGIMIHKGTWHDFPLAVADSVTVLTANSPEVIEALASMTAAVEMDHGDVYKIDFTKHVGKILRIKLN